MISLKESMVCKGYCVLVQHLLDTSHKKYLVKHVFYPKHLKVLAWVLK